MDDYPPTAEQAYVVEQFTTAADTGEPLVVNAYAGAGKTSTLQFVAKAAGRRGGRYIAFNKSIADEASRKFPRTVACSTAHSLAHRAVGRNMAHRLNGVRMRGADVAELLAVQPFACLVGDRPKTLAPKQLGGVVMLTVLNFCKSADLEPGPQHVPYVEGIDAMVGEQRGHMNNRALKEHLLPAVRRAWADLLDPAGRLPYGHAHYLKAWHVTGAYIPGSYLMLDEAQDLNPVLLAIARQQHHLQLVYVGDSFQQIYSFTGALNALGSIDGARHAHLSQSFRFGPAIADLANIVLGDLGAKVPLTGLASISSSVGPIYTPDAILTRGNTRAVSLMLQAMRAGRRPHLIGGGEQVQAFAFAAQELQDTGATEYPDLACFDNWLEVLEYVDQDPQGDELALMVKLVQEFGTSTLLAALGRMSPERNANLIISTTHKAKGREWGRVQLAGDFPDPSWDDDECGMSDEERRLIYVAATRGQHQVDVEQVAYFAGRVPA